MAFNTQASTKRLFKKIAEQDRQYAEWLAKKKAADEKLSQTQPR